MRSAEEIDSELFGADGLDIWDAHGRIEWIRAIQRDAFDAGAEAVKQLAKLHCDEYGASDARDAIEEINPKHLVARP